MRIDKAQKFFSVLQDLFVGAKLEGKSGYLNLMNIKTKYFERIREMIENRIQNDFLLRESNERDEVYDKLYTFFNNYFSEGGAIFFVSTPVYKNIYAKVYSDREDVALFWKTQNLYYVKTEANYQSVKNLALEENNSIRFDFDASELEHKKANEKKELAFYFVGLKRKEEKNGIKYILKFKVRYKEGIKYDKLKEILNIENIDELKKYLKEHLNNLNNPHIKVIRNDIDISIVNFKNKTKNGAKGDLLITDKEDDVFESIVIEPVITDTEEIVKYCRKKGVFVVSEEDILKAFRIYKRQNEIDYFIHKDARSFLREQFNLYIYQYLTNDLDTVFDQKRLDTVRKIKEIAYFVIDLIGRFEDELKKIWLKPKFVRKSNYVITLDRILEKPRGGDVIKKILENTGIEEQIKEWKELGIVGEDFKKEDIFNNGIFKGISERYKHLPIDTKYFDEDIKYSILSLFDNLDDELDGWLIKSDNFQALNTILPKFKEKVQTIYIDPPFNLGTNADFLYDVNYKDSTWITMLENRINIARDILNDKGSIFVRCDYNGNMYVRLLLNKIFGEENFRNEIILRKVNYQGTNVQGRFNPAHDLLYFYNKEESKSSFNIIFKEREREPNWINAVSPKENKKQYKINIAGREFIAPKDHHWRFSQTKFDKLYAEGRIKIKEEYEYIDVLGHKQVGIPQYLESEVTPVDSNWVDISGYSFGWHFSTENSEILLKRVIQSTSNEGDLVMDFFLGSGTTTAVAHKLKRKWIGVEIGEHFYTVILPRMKKVLFYDKSGISKEKDVKEKYNEKQAGGFFKYYEIEQFEDTLRKAVYKPKDEKLENIEFNIDLKLAKDGIYIDYEKETAKYTFYKLYPDIDIPETISNLIGKHIKKITKNKVVFEDDFEVELNNLTFEKYPFLKPLVWWE